MDSVQYVLDVRWNAREAAWFLDILAEDETPIISGVKIVLGTTLGRRSADSAKPAGLLRAFDLSGRSEEAGFDDLGTRVVVYYFSADEVA